jgi:hypothetical protein
MFEYVFGDPHSVKPDPSRLHAKDEFGSLLVNAKVAEALLLSAGGPDAIVVCGATVSIFHVYAVGSDPRDGATTLNVCVPSERPE